MTNYNDLQNFDPGHPLTIQWESLTQGEVGLGGCIEVGVSYWDETLREIDLWTIWDLPIDQLNEFGALSATVTSVTIPANTLVGSPYGIYTVNFFFVRFDSLDDAVNVSGANKYVLIPHEGIDPNGAWIFVPRP